MRRTLITLILIVGILSTAGWIQSRPIPQNWEYKFDYNVGEKRANQLAAEGWELIAIGTSGSGPTSNVQTFVFKRAR